MVTKQIAGSYDPIENNVAANFTGVAVALGNLKLAAEPNIFADEFSAREAVGRAKKGKHRPA